MVSELTKGGIEERNGGDRNVLLGAVIQDTFHGIALSLDDLAWACRRRRGIRTVGGSFIELKETGGRDFCCIIGRWIGWRFILWGLKEFDNAL